jgi:hypothetical protein
MVWWVLGLRCKAVCNGHRSASPSSSVAIAVVAVVCRFNLVKSVYVDAGV